jgi:prolipoprotein diacylglyceryltransferase
MTRRNRAVALRNEPSSLLTALAVPRGRPRLYECCQSKPAWFTLNDEDGVPRWPAAPVEIGFNALMATAFFILRRWQKLAGQHFHIYLMTYGAFRFVHEFLRHRVGWDRFQAINWRRWSWRFGAPFVFRGASTN